MGLIGFFLSCLLIALYIFGSWFRVRLAEVLLGSLDLVLEQVIPLVNNLLNRRIRDYLHEQLLEQLEFANNRERRLRQRLDFLERQQREAELHPEEERRRQRQQREEALQHAGPHIHPHWREHLQAARYQLAGRLNQDLIQFVQREEQNQGHPAEQERIQGVLTPYIRNYGLAVDAVLPLNQDHLEQRLYRVRFDFLQREQERGWIQ